MLQLSHQPHPLPNPPTTSTLRTHPLTPLLITQILTSPYSRYSKLSSLISQAQSLLPPPSTNTTQTRQQPVTISLPPLNPFAVSYLLSFLSGTPPTAELEASVRKGDVRRAFEVLGVDFPPGFDHYGGMGDGVEMGEEGGKYIRGRDDYTSREVYEARMRIEMEEGGFGVNVGYGGNVGMNNSRRSEEGNNNNGSSRVRGEEINRPVSHEQAPAQTTATTLSTIITKDAAQSPPPAYAGPSSSTHLLDTKSASGPSTFQETLHNALLTKLSTLLLSHIHPALTTQATLGIFRGTFILLCDPFWSTAQIPLNNVATSSPHENIGTVNGYREIINLPCGTEGEGFSMAFLAQEVVVQGLKKVIGKELGVVEPPPRPPTPPPREPTPPPPKKGWLGLGGLGKKKKKEKVREVVEEVVPVVVEMEEGTKVDVRMEDVWVRWEGTDGLVKTRGGKGVVVWVEVLG